MVRWLRWHCPPDTGFEIRALAVWGRARYLSVTEAPHNTNFHTWMGKKQFCFFQTAETGNRTPDSGVKGSGANHYPRAPAQKVCDILDPKYGIRWVTRSAKLRQVISLEQNTNHFLIMVISNCYVFSSYLFMFSISISNYVILNQCLLQLCWITFYFRSVQKMLLLNIIKDSIILSLWR